MSDRVNSPSHYNQGGFELADVIDAFKLDRWSAQAAQYVFRAPHKDAGARELEDIEKAIWFLQRRAKQLRDEAEFVEVPRTSAERRIGGIPADVTIGEAIDATSYPQIFAAAYCHRLDRTDFSREEPLPDAIARLPAPDIDGLAQLIVDAGWRVVAARQAVTP